MTTTNTEIGAFINSLTEDTSPDTANDMLLEYDASAGAVKKVKQNKVGAASGVGADGWAVADAMTYASADSPTFTMTCSGDQTGKYFAGMRIKLTQTTVKYFIITKVEYSSSTTITLYGGTDYTLANAAISDPYYSSAKAPAGFPLDPAKWTVETTDTSNRSQSNPTQNSWYNLNSLSISIPIGCWLVNYQVIVESYDDSAGSIAVQAALSTANNSASDAALVSRGQGNWGSQADSDLKETLSRSKYLTLTAKTVYYLNARVTHAGAGSWTVQFRGDEGTTIIRAVCSYL